MDPVRTEIMRNRFAAIAEEASSVAYRTAYTTFVKQTQDYQVALASTEGEFFAYPVRSGVTSSVCQNVRGVVDQIGIAALRPGDVIVTNDPFAGDALCTHTMDIHLLRPVFRDGVPVAFGWAFIHASDIGGSVPGSIAPTNWEVFQEGVRIRTSLLYREGELNQPLWHFFADNSRIPELIWGDLQAMLAGLALLDRRLQELCDRVGAVSVLESVRDVLALSELKARAAITRLTDGEYAFADYLEAFGDAGPIFIQACLRKSGETLAMDFDGSDPQVRYALNFTTSERPHPFLCMPIVNWIQTVEPTTPRTGGIIRPISTTAPRGTLMNATFPAAMGNRWVAVMRVYDVILGCLNQAVPGGIAAAGAGQAGVISVSAVDRRTGRRNVSVVEPFIGGSGGRNGADGIDGIDQPVAFLRSAPVETVELETDLVVRRFCYEPGSAAPGRYRGGLGMRIEIENRGLPATVTVRGQDRFRLEPWGFAGGGCGRPGRTTVTHEGEAAERDIGRIDVLELPRGAVLRMTTPSGGGFGAPSLRDPALVANEVADGLLSPEEARTLYGDGAASPPHPAVTSFTFGPERRALEARWPIPARAALARAVMAAPPQVRAFLLDDVRKELDGGDVAITPSRVEAAVRRRLS